MLLRVCEGLFLAIWLSLTCAEFNGFEENLLFKINWLGPTNDLLRVADDDTNIENSILMTSADNEAYKCILPDTSSYTESEKETYAGASALELLRPLMKKDSCIYKVEQFWAYELCHGTHLKQFHEEKEAGKDPVVQEYYLGRYNADLFNEAVEKFAQNTAAENKVNHIKLDGHYFPYVMINMTDGTLCDLNGKPRSTRIKYICYPDMKHQIYSLDEISTCEYEVLVVTYLLCQHPDYNLKTPSTNEIKCHSVGDAPTRPTVLQELEQESYDLNPNNNRWRITKKQFEIPEEQITLPSSLQDSVIETTTPYDPKLVKDFLQGEHCLYGGSGWWKYEFCYGKKVEQYHQETDGSRAVILLGIWDKQKHLQWLKNSPHKKPKLVSNKRQVSHYYSNGDRCTETSNFRHVEVRLKCKDSSNHPNAVTMALLEPAVCEYILVVESPILCPLLPKADENGLIELQDIKD